MCCKGSLFQESVRDLTDFRDAIAVKDRGLARVCVFSGSKHCLIEC